MFNSLTAARRREAALASPAPRHGGWLARDDVAMGTPIHVQLWCDEPARGEAAAAAVLEEMHRIDRCMSPVKPDSELARINRAAQAAAVPVSDEMFGLLAQALAYSRFSDGAFDITYASAGQLYDYRAGTAPGEAELARACAAIGWRHLHLDAATRSVRFGRPGMRIDLGGFAKGHAVDNAAAILARHGIAHAIVSAGGDSRVIGDRRGRPWTVAVRHPRREAEPVAVLPLQDVSISTSGDYERCFIGADGVRRHHILDPRTGRSPLGVQSATVLAPSGLACEALSKCLFVLGPERGLRLLQAVPGADAVVVDAHGRLHTSPGLQHANAA